ncbi:MAG: Yip1 family protein [Gemmatimonadota bacterium]
MTQPTASAPATKVSRWEDFIDVFFSPVELFRRRADGKFGVALVFFVVMAAALYFATRSAMAPVFDAEFRRGMAAMMKANPSVTAEQLAAGKGFAQTFGGVLLLVGAPIGVFLLGLVVWLVAKLMGGVIGYTQAVTIATYSFFPRLVESLVNALQAAFLDERSITSRLSVTLGVGRFLPPDHTNPFVAALLGRVDLFTLWVTVLIGVGIKVIAKTTAAQAAIAAVLVWLIGALPVLFQAYRGM